MMKDKDVPKWLVVSDFAKISTAVKGRSQFQRVPRFYASATMRILRMDLDVLEITDRDKTKGTAEQVCSQRIRI